MSDFIDDSGWAIGLLASVIYIPQELHPTRSARPACYPHSFQEAFSRNSPEDVDELFEHLSRLMKLGPNDTEGEAHRIMRTAAEQVHAPFQNLNRESVLNTANYVLVMRDAWQSLIGLVEDVEDDSDTLDRF